MKQVQKGAEDAAAKSVSTTGQLRHNNVRTPNLQGLRLSRATVELGAVVKER